MWRRARARAKAVKSSATSFITRFRDDGVRVSRSLQVQPTGDGFARSLSARVSPRCYSSSDPRMCLLCVFLVWRKSAAFTYSCGAFHRGMIAGSLCLRLRFREMDACIKIARCMYVAQFKAPFSTWLQRTLRSWQLSEAFWLVR